MAPGRWGQSGLGTLTNLPPRVGLAAGGTGAVCAGPTALPAATPAPLFSLPSTCQGSVAKNTRWIAALSAPKPPSLQVKPRVLPVAHRARRSAHPFTCLLPSPGSSLTHGHPGCSDKPGTVAPQGICSVQSCALCLGPGSPGIHELCSSSPRDLFCRPAYPPVLSERSRSCLDAELLLR